MGISQNSIACNIGVTPRHINEIISLRHPLTAGTDLRLFHFFGTPEGYWLKLQADFNLEERRLKIRKQLDKIKLYPKFNRTKK